MVGEDSFELSQSQTADLQSGPALLLRRSPAERLGAPWSDRTTVADIPNQPPAIERRELAERPVFETEARRLDPVTAVRLSACALRIGGRRRNRTPDLAVTLGFRTSRQPSSGAFHWYPCADSNRKPPRSKRGTSTRLGYKGELVLAERFERSLDGLSTRFLCRLGYASGAARGIRTLTEPGLSRRPLPNLG